jgi:quinol monooxygenase YgiN
MRRRTFLAVSATAAAMFASGTTTKAQQTPDATGELNAFATLQVHADKEAEVEAILRALQATTLANDKGCLRYEWYRASIPQTYILLERWADQAAAQQHLNTTFANVLEKLLPLILQHPQVVRLTKL